MPPLCALLCSGLNSSVHFVELLWCLNEIINEREGLYIVSKYLLLGNEDDFFNKEELMCSWRQVENHSDV